MKIDHDSQDTGCQPSAVWHALSCRMTVCGTSAWFCSPHSIDMITCSIDAVPVLFSLGFLLLIGFILLCSHLSHRQILLPAQLSSRDWPEGLGWPAELLTDGCSTRAKIEDRLKPEQGQMGSELQWRV